jgi:hypothetical protein
VLSEHFARCLARLEEGKYSAEITEHSSATARAKLDPAIVVRPQIIKRFA